MLTGCAWKIQTHLAVAHDYTNVLRDCRDGRECARPSSLRPRDLAGHAYVLRSEHAATVKTPTPFHGSHDAKRGGLREIARQKVPSLTDLSLMHSPRYAVPQPSIYLSSGAEV